MGTPVMGGRAGSPRQLKFLLSYSNSSYWMVTKLCHNAYRHNISVKFGNKPDRSRHFQVMTPSWFQKSIDGVWVLQHSHYTYRQGCGLPDQWRSDSVHESGLTIHRSNHEFHNNDKDNRSICIFTLWSTISFLYHKKEV